MVRLFLVLEKTRQNITSIWIGNHLKIVIFIFFSFCSHTSDCFPAETHTKWNSVSGNQETQPLKALSLKFVFPAFSNWFKMKPTEEANHPFSPPHHLDPP